MAKVIRAANEPVGPSAASPRIAVLWSGLLVSTLDTLIMMLLGQANAPGGFGGMFGGLMMVAFVLIAIRKAPPGPIGRLMAAGATSPETALKPQTAKILHQYELRPALKKGLVFELDDGRCWVDVPKVKRRRLRIAIVVAVLLGVAAEAVFLGLRSVGLL